jgi:hypothetical protein
MKKIKSLRELLQTKKEILNKVFNLTYTDIRILEWELLNELVHLRELIKTEKEIATSELLEILNSSINNSNKIREKVAAVGELLYPEKICKLYDAVENSNTAEVKNLLEKGITPDECYCPFVEANLLEFARKTDDKKEIIEILKEYGATE